VHQTHTTKHSASRTRAEIRQRRLDWSPSADSCLTISSCSGSGKAEEVCQHHATKAGNLLDRPDNMTTTEIWKHARLHRPVSCLCQRSARHSHPRRASRRLPGRIQLFFASALQQRRCLPWPVGAPAADGDSSLGFDSWHKEDRRDRCVFARAVSHEFSSIFFCLVGSRCCVTKAVYLSLSFFLMS
jgi:hypothetical protein